MIKNTITRNTTMIKTTLATSVLTFALVNNAIAASTMVTDAVGTQELWTFQQIQGAERLTSKINQVDGKGVTQTWDSRGNMLTRTDSEGRVTSYTYNAFNQRLSMTEAFGTAQARTTTYEYVSADIDLVTKTTSPSIYNSSSKSVTNVYDAEQNIKSVTISGFDAQGGVVTRSTSFEHDEFGKVVEIDGPRTDVNDITTLAYYDCNSGAQCGQLQSVTNAAGHVSSYDTYDAVARLTQSTDANGVVTNYVYHPRGWLLSMTQVPPTGATRVTTYEYDNVGQLIKTVMPDGTEQNYVYDAAHDLREIFDNLGNSVAYKYDAKGNRTEELVRDPDGTLVRSTITSYDIRNFIESINNGGSVTQLINDAVGNLSTQTDPNVNPSTSNSFDALDRLTNTVDALTNNSVYEYDVADQLTEVTSPNGSVTQYEYDDLGNQTSEISADRGTIVYTHDDAGNVVSMTDARGVTASYQYDVLNRLTNVQYPNASESITYFYDTGCEYSLGRLCQVSDDSGVDLYDYDAWGNVTRCEKTEIDEAGLAIGVYETSYQYDNANRIVQTTYPSGRVVSTGRDAIGRLVTLTTTDANAVVTPIVQSRVYRADGFWTEQSYGNGLIQTKTYDLQGRLTDHQAGNYSRQYSFDANGNILKASDAAVSPTTPFDTDYTYDVLDRLVATNSLVDSLIKGYDYDANGNRQQLTTGAVDSNLNYSPNTNRLEDIDGSAITLDASGRTLSDNEGRGFVYNDAGRLFQISKNGTLAGQYAYNYQQLRTQKLVAGVTTLYHYDLAGNLIAESNGTEVIQEYVYADGERVATFARVDVANDGSGGSTGDTTPVVDPVSLVGGQTYGGSQDDPSTGPVTLSDNDTSISLAGNRWRAIPFNYTVTENTVLSFDFSSVSQGEIHGIGFDDNLSISQNRTFQLYGTQSWGINAYQDYDGNGVRSYTIPVGQFYQGVMSYIGLTMDDDANKAGDSLFSNIRVYEQETSTSNTNGSMDLSTFLPYGGTQDDSTTGSVAVGSEGELSLKGNRWQKVPISVDITPTTELRFDFKSDTQGEIHGIGVDNDNAISSNLTFAVWGTQSWGDRSQYGYTGAGDYQSYVVPIGQIIAAGNYRYLTFAMDDDSAKNGQSVFRNVEFIDPNNPVVPDEPELEVGVQFYINDHLMTPQRLVNQNGDDTWSATYEAFGSATIETELVTNNHRFPGQYFDSESGLYYNWNRYYDSETGRYVTSDPIGLGGGLNTFGYVRGNPLKRADPSGLVEWSGVVTTFQGGSLLGAAVIEANLVSECVNGEKMRIWVRAYVFGADFGISAGAIVSNETFDDRAWSNDTIDPTNFNGEAFMSTAGAAVFGGVSSTHYKLGQAVNSDTRGSDLSGFFPFPSPSIGFDLGIGIMSGYSNVVRQFPKESCSCEQF